MMRFRRTFGVCLLSLFCGGTAFVMFGNAASHFPLPQEPPNLSNASAVVKPRIFVSLDPVPRAREFKVAVVVDIASGFHMNSHKPSEEYLIATTLTPKLPPDFELIDTIYPKGQLEKFSFSPKQPLDVYTGSVTFLLRLSAKAAATLGPTEIPMVLRYQACNDSTCLPPVKFPLSAKFELAKEGTTSREVHSEVFSRLVPAH
jgi:cytochrome c biogenesis DsbD-like protein